jgi:hypothetical protein
MTPMTFEQLLVQYQTLVEKALAESLMSAAPEPESYRKLCHALECELEHFGDKKSVAAKMLAEELMSRVRFPEGGGAVEMGVVGGGYSELSDDVEAQANMEMPETRSLGVGVYIKTKETK